MYAEVLDVTHLSKKNSVKPEECYSSQPLKQEQSSWRLEEHPLGIHREADGVSRHDLGECIVSSI